MQSPPSPPAHYSCIGSSGALCVKKNKSLARREFHLFTFIASQGVLALSHLYSESNVSHFTCMSVKRLAYRMFGWGGRKLE